MLNHFDDIYIEVYRGENIISEGWQFIQSIDVSETPQYMQVEQIGSTKKRRIRMGGSYQVAVSQIFSDEPGVWDVEDGDTIRLYHAEIFSIFANIAVTIPTGTSYVEIQDISLGEKRLSAQKGNDIIINQTLTFEGIDWDASTES